MTIDFKPSQVDLFASFPPLADTFGKAELEHAAAVLVRAGQVLGDQWWPVTIAQAVEVLAIDGTNKAPPFDSLVLNPFFNPDFVGLLDKGFAQSAPDNRVVLTELGLERLRRYVR